MTDIDREVDRLVQRSSDRIDGGSIAPDLTRREGTLDMIDDPEIRREHPATVNPPAEELRFDVAQEVSSVDERLTRLRQRQHEGNTERITLDLPAVWRQVQKTGPEFLAAEEDYLLDAINLLIERHLWSPRLFGTSNLTFDSAQVDGDSTTALRVINELGVRQRLPFGGEAAASWVWSASENLRSAATGQYVQASSLTLDASIPLLRGAGDVARESLIQTERNLIYSARDFEATRRDLLAGLARDYFDLVRQKNSIANTLKQLASVQLVVKQNEALNDAGRVPLFEVDQARNQLLSARANLVNQEEGYLLGLDRFKIRLGLPALASIELEDYRLDVPEPGVTLAEAAAAALSYRLDLQNARDQLEDSLRGVRNTRNDILPDLDLSGSVSFPTDVGKREGGVVYEPDDVRYGAGLLFSLPLDRKIERLRLRAAIVGYQRAVRNFEQFRDNLVLDVRARVREIERAQINLELARQQVHITERRAEEQQIKRDEIETRDILDTENDLRQARDSRDQAETDLRNAILDYLVVTGQMRVQRDGTFQPLPGMDEPPPPRPPLDRTPKSPIELDNAAQ